MNKDPERATRHETSPTVFSTSSTKAGSLDRETLDGDLVLSTSMDAQTIGDASGESLAAKLEQVGSRVGSFTLVQQIGEGGMGTVFLAEQTQPITRRVAVKIIKPGMDSSRIITRFEAERQAISLMEHPNIVRVLEVGTTAAGRPYFAMEFVTGLPITQYCDEHRLPVPARLDLFRAVCSGVQHAHQKGIIHRDLKPSNVLVTEIDGKMIPKIIDFGLAKALDQSMTEQPMLTQMGQVVGTLEYMSPEQSGLNPADVDTRTDIYSLGVLLYELLTGTTPFDKQRLRKASFDQVLRSIREDDTVRPSHQLSIVQSSAEVASNRGTELRRLTGQLRGDLDWIVMKALEKDRSRRYETANGLSMDVQRYLTGEPVLAAPPSLGYRLRKFVRRNKAAVIAASLIGLALVAGLIGTAYGLRQAVAAGAREKQAKEFAQNEAARATRAEAEAVARADEAKLLADFQSGMLKQIDPNRSGLDLSEDVRTQFAAALVHAGVAEGDRAKQQAEFEQNWQRVNPTDAARDLIDRAILRPAVATIERQFGGQPLVAALLRQTLADRYEQLGLYDAALELQNSALEIRTRELGPDDPDTLVSLTGLGIVLQRKGNFAEAEKCFRDALQKRRKVLGDTHADTLQSIGWLGYLLDQQGRFAEAEPLLRESLEASRQTLSPQHPTTLDGIAALGFCLARQKRYDEAEPLVREGLELRRKVLSSDHRDVVASLSHLGTLLADQKKYAAAQPYLEEGFATATRVLGANHSDTLTLSSRLAKVLQEQGNLPQAEAQYRLALDTARQILGSDDAETLSIINNLGLTLRGQGKLNEAEPFYREAWERYRQKLGDKDPLTLRALNNMGALLWSQEKYSEAEECLTQAVAGRREALGDRDTETLISLNNLGGLLRDQNRLAEAEQCYREAVQGAQVAFGATHNNTLIFSTNLGSVLVAQDKLAEGIELLVAQEPRIRANFRESNLYRVAFLLLNLGKGRTKQAKSAEEFAQAEANLLEAEAIYAKTPGPSPKDNRACLQALVDFYVQRHAVAPQENDEAEQTKWQTRVDAFQPPGAK